MGMPQKIRCTVERIIDHGGHVYTLELVPERSAPQFLPGQFMHLAIDPYEPGDFWPESRVFSIASTPSQRNMLRITYSVVGSFTTKMEKSILTGSNVWVKFPYGEFVIQNKKDIALIAGGTGITAFTAFLESLDVQQENKVCLFYGARNSELLVYKSLIEKKNDVPALSVQYYIEEGEFEEKRNMVPGRLSVQSIMANIQNPQNTDYYLSGPPVMLNSFRQELLVQGIHNNQIKIDAWA